MEDKKFEEKDEKQFDEKDEKELRKHDEKVEERDALSSVVWSAILIWAGLVFLAINTGWLDKFMAGRVFSGFMPRGMEMFEPGAWGIIMLGAGVIILAEFFIRLLVPSFRRHIGGRLIVAAVFIGIGLGSLFDWTLVWPFILIAVGVGVLLGGLLRAKS